MTPVGWLKRWRRSWTVHRQRRPGAQRRCSDRRPNRTPAPMPAFDADTVRKVDFRTWKWEDRVFVGVDAAFQAADKVLKKLGFTVKNVDYPTRITAGKG